MNVTLFLGAGFSVPFGNPAMNEFFHITRESGRVDQGEIKFLDDLILEARKANSFLQSSSFNLEDVLSFSVMGDRLNLDGDATRSLRTRKILQKVYATPRDIAGYWDKYKIFRTFLGNKLGDFRKTLSIVTTNYDINVESALRSMGGIKSNPGFEPKQVEDKQNLGPDVFYSQDGIPVYKLHGSINWFFQSEGDIVFTEGRVAEVMGAKENFKLPLVCTQGYNFSGEPFIVPPSFLKPDMKSSLSLIWQGAARALKNAEIVVFVGYSFPPTDTEMMYFFAQSFYNNPRIRKIIIIDIIADRIVERLSRADKTGSQFKDFLMPVTASWKGEILDEYL